MNEAKRNECVMEPLVRSPLARGRRYQYKGFRSGFRVKHVAFRGHPEDDGGLQGVAIQWEGFPSGGREGSGFYPCKSDAEFFRMLIFSNAYDRPNNDMTGGEPAGKDQK